jgi:hypothetical protein
MSNPFRQQLNQMSWPEYGDSQDKAGYELDERVRNQMRELSRRADEWDKNKEDASRSNARDPYEVGTGSAAALGQPSEGAYERTSESCKDASCAISGGRRRKTKRAKKSRKYKKSRARR